MNLNKLQSLSSYTLKISLIFVFGFFAQINQSKSDDIIQDEYTMLREYERTNDYVDQLTTIAVESFQDEDFNKVYGSDYIPVAIDTPAGEFMPIEPTVKYKKGEKLPTRISATESKLDAKTKEYIFMIVQEIHYLKAAIRDMYLDKEASIQKSPYQNVNNENLIKQNIIPLKFLSPQPSTVSEIQNMGDPWGFTAVNRYGGAVLVEGVGPEYKYFRITYSGLPAKVCAGLLMARWEDNYLGTMWIGANGKFFSWARELQANPMPVSPKEAVALCKNGGYFQIGFK